MTEGQGSPLMQAQCDPMAKISFTSSIKKEMKEEAHSSPMDAHIMNSMKLVIPLLNKTPNDAVSPQRQSQFTPKMKANAVPRLLSSLV